MMDTNQFKKESQGKIKDFKWGIPSEMPKQRMEYVQSQRHYSVTQFASKKAQKQPIENFEYVTDPYADSIEKDARRVQNLQKLNELKSEHEILRQTVFDSKIIKANHHSHKISELSEMISSSKPSKKEKHKSSASISNLNHKSHKSSKHHIKSHAHDDNQNQMNNAKSMQQLYVEKQRLEMMLSNCMLKMEEILRSEIDLKNKNHELQELLRKTKRMHEDSPKENGTGSDRIKISEYESRFEEERRVHRELIGKIGKLEGELSANEIIILKLQQQRSRLSQDNINYRIKISECEIDNKRLKMEYEIREKQYNQDCRQLNAEIEGLRKSKGSSFERQKIFMLERQIESKQRHHQEILEELKNQKKAVADTQITEIFEKITKAKENNESAIQVEIEKLKQQIQSLKGKTDLTTSQFGFESKVLSLQKAIKKQSDEKEQFVSEMQKVKGNYEDLQQKYSELQRLLEASKANEKKLQKQLAAAGDHLQSSSKKNAELSINQQENAKLLIRIEELEKIIESYEEAHKQFSQLQTLFNARSQELEGELKVAKRRADQAEFEAMKTQQQSEMNLNMNVRALKMELYTLNRNMQEAVADRNRYRAQLQNAKKHNQQLSIRLKQIEFAREERSRADTYEKRQKQENLRRAHDNELSSLKEGFLFEQSKLLLKIESLSQANEQFLIEAQKMSHYETQLLELRRMRKKMMALDSSIIHLWQIKEVEYGNVNEILSQFKASQNLTRSNVADQQKFFPLP